MLPRRCHSGNRCSDLQCSGCVWRYCRSQAIQILTKSTGPLHTIALTIPDPTPEGFRSWRVEIRNRIDHLRRVEVRWRKFGIHVWLQRDGTIRGIVTRGLLGLYDVVRGLERWEPMLGPEVGPKDLRVAIWGLTKPSVIYADGAGRGRYWPVRCSIWPCRAKAQHLHQTDKPLREHFEPMPWLI